MHLIQNLAGDEFRAKYGYIKFYIKQFAILTIKCIFMLSSLMLFFIFFFVIMTPEPTTTNIHPIFEVKKSNQNNMITIYTNKHLKKQFCHNQSSIYYGKLYTKHQFCQFQHEEFPFNDQDGQIVNVQILGINKNVIFVTACIVKVNEEPSVCQKFSFKENQKIFNKLKLEELYSIEIELQMEKESDFFGEVTINFQKENYFIINFMIQYYFIVSILASMLMSGILTFSFIVFNIPQILQKGKTKQKKIKQG